MLSVEADIDAAPGIRVYGRRDDARPRIGRTISRRPTLTNEIGTPVFHSHQKSRRSRENTYDLLSVLTPSSSEMVLYSNPTPCICIIISRILVLQSLPPLLANVVSLYRQYLYRLFR